MTKRERRLRAEIRFLEPLESRAETSTDAIPDEIADTYSDGGKWVGQIAAQLLREELIYEFRTIRSVRPSRHKGKIGLFGTRDIAAVQARISLLRLQLETLMNSGDSAASTVAVETKRPVTQLTLPGID